MLRLLLGALPSWSKAAIVPAMSAVSYHCATGMLIRSISPPVSSTGSPTWQLEDTVLCLKRAVLEGRLPTVRALAFAVRNPASGYKGDNEHIRELLGECLGEAAKMGDPQIVHAVLVDTKGSFTKAALLAAVLRAPLAAAALRRELLRPIKWMQQQLMPAVSKAATQHGDSVLVLEELLRTPREQPWRIGILASTIDVTARQGKRSFKQLRALVSAASSDQPPFFRSYGFRPDFFRPGDFTAALEVAASKGDVVFLARLLRLPGVVWDSHALISACYAAIGHQESTEPLRLLLSSLPGVWARYDISSMIRRATEGDAKAQYVTLLKHYGY